MSVPAVFTVLATMVVPPSASICVAAVASGEVSLRIRCRCGFGGRGGVRAPSVLALVVVLVVNVVAVMTMFLAVMTVVRVMFLRRGAVGGCSSSLIACRSGSSPWQFTGIVIFQTHIVHTGIEIFVFTFNKIVRVRVHGQRHDGTSVGEDSNKSESGCRRHV
jgi:hypothetical protein